MHLGISHETADWVNRVGMLFSFLAFWFAAPQFIGAVRLKRWEKRLESAIEMVPSGSSTIVAFIALFAAPIVLLIAAGWAFKLAFHIPDQMPDQWPYWWSHGVLPAIVVVILGVGILLGLRLGLFVASPLGARAERAMSWMFKPILGRLAHDGRIRRRSLCLGAVLFTLGFILQFAATFPGPESK